MRVTTSDRRDELHTLAIQSRFPPLILAYWSADFGFRPSSACIHSIVRASPAASGTLGSHPRSDLALEMSGHRRVGSSSGSG